jgi:phage baseplate assembly protein V
MAGFSRETLRQVEMMLQPLSMRQRNMVARAQLLLVDDGKKLQSLQVAVPETVPDGEHYQPYGFSSVPLAGAEGVALFPSGDRGHPLVIVMSDRRYRPTGGEPGEVTVYNNTGASMTITKDGDIIARPAAGRSMLVDDGSGATALPTMADFNGIVSIMNAAGTGAATALPAAVALYQAAHPTWPDGTKVLKGK